MHFYNRYFIITSITFIILEPVDEKYKNICRINYVGDLFAIEKVETFINTEEEYKDLSCFKIKWNKNYNNQLTIPMCGDSKTFVIKNICECLEKRRDSMRKTFKIIEKEDNVNIKIYEEINSLYQKIIEKLASSNGDDFKKYLEKLQNFINKYDKLKMKINNENESHKNK